MKLGECLGKVNIVENNGVVLGRALGEINISSDLDTLKNNDISKIAESLSSGKWLDESKRNEYTNILNKYNSAMERYQSYYDSFDEDKKAELPTFDFSAAKSATDYMQSLIKEHSRYKTANEYNESIKQYKLQEEMKSADLGALASENKALEEKIVTLKKEYEVLWNEYQSASVSNLKPGQGKNKGVKTTDDLYSEYNKKSTELKKQIKKLQKESEDKKAYYKSAKQYQELVKITESAYQDKDFDKISQAGADLQKLSYEKVIPTKGFIHLQKGETVDNPIMFVHNNKERLFQELASSANSGGSVNLKALNKYGSADWINKILKMTDDEISIYNYYLAQEKSGEVKKGTADKYISIIEDVLTDRIANKIKNNINNIDNDFLRKVTKGTYSVIGGLDSWATGVKQNFTDEQLPTSVIAATNQKIASELKGIDKYIYLAGNTVGNMLPSILISKGIGGLSSAFTAPKAIKGIQTVAKVAGATTMGASASGNAYQTALAEGYDKDRARVYGLLVGASEASLEYLLGGITDLGGISAEKLLAKASNIDKLLVKIAANSAISIGSEITEEELQLVLEPAIKKIVLGADYDLPKMKEILETAIVTAISTGVLGSRSNVIRPIAESSYAKSKYGNNIQGLINEGLALPNDTVGFKLATKYQEYFNNKKTLSGTQLHNLSQAIEKESMQTARNEGIKKEQISLEEFANRDSEIWRNVDYSDNETKAEIMNETHNRMIAEGNVVKVSDETQKKVEESYPDLRSIKKKERTPILKAAMDTLKNNLRQFLNGFKSQNFEFEVNGKVLEAKLYNTGINEVLEKITQEKANMLYSTEEIFKNAQYLYSTADYDGDPNVYRWNYFYTPVQIGEETVGVRIAVRDMATPKESQIYNWNIKKDTSLDDAGRGKNNRISHGVSSDVSNNTVLQNDTGVNNNISDEEQKNTQADPNGPANFMPETAKDTQDFALESGVKALLLSTANKKRHHTTKAEQKFIKKICHALGRKVVFEHISAVDETGLIPDGYIDKNNVIHIGFTVVDPVKFVFKHELTHFGEGTEQYNKFIEAVKSSKLFKKWLIEQVGNRVSNKMDLDALITAYGELIADSRNENNTDWVAEMYADFVGDCLFNDNGSGLKALLKSVDSKHKPTIIQYVLDFLAYLKAKISGDNEITFEMVQEISNLENEFRKMLQEANATEQTRSIERTFTFARVQDKSLIKQAEQIEEELKSKNKSSEEIRRDIWKELQIIRDTVGVWVYEIDDRKMHFFPDGDAINELSSELKEYYKLADLGRKTAEKRKRYEELRKKYGAPFYRKGKLKDFLKHDELFEKFPRLKETNFEFKAILTPAEYDPNTDTIAFNAERLIKNKGLKGLDKFYADAVRDIEFEESMVHEIQHALQVYEDRERGSSPEYWNKRLLRGERLPINPETNEEYEPFDAYMATNGEYEARESEKRKWLVDWEREEVVPDLGWGKTISAKEPALAKNEKISQALNDNYISAAENTDMETAQRLTDDAAKLAGYTERLYHQTGAEFTEFNTKNQKAGKYDNELPTGIFLKPSDSDIGLKGKKQMELYAKIENSLTFENREEAREFWKENIEGYAEAERKIKKIDSEYRLKTDEAMNNVRAYLKEWRQSNPDVDSREIYQDNRYQELNDYKDSIVDEWEEKSNAASTEAKKLIDNFISESGYDGIIVEKDQGSGGRYTKTYIVFNSNQLKDASPVTYDDNGNIIPLSERFNVFKKDIRYSIPRKNVDTEPIDLSNDNELSKRIGDTRGAEKYKIIQNYIIEALGEQPVTLSDGKVAYVDRSDALHMANKSGQQKTAHISQIRKIIDSAKLVAEEGSKKERKFDYFYYYEAVVKYRNDMYPIYLNVGRSVNDGTYHIYDITKKLRDTAHRVNDVERPKPNEGYALKNGISNNSISKFDNKVNKKFSIPNELRTSLRLYKEGVISYEEYQEVLDNLWDNALSNIKDKDLVQRLQKELEEQKEITLNNAIDSARHTNQLKKRIKRQNEQLAKRRSEISAEITAQREERATRQKNIEYIRKTVSRIDKMLRTNSETKHVPEELKEGIKHFVSIFVENDRSPFDKKDLRYIYLTYSDALRESTNEEVISGLDEDALRSIKILRDSLDGKTLRDLNYHETLLVKDIVDNFAQIIKWENEMFIAGKQYEYNEVGQQAMRELTLAKSKRENKITKVINDRVVFANMTPIYFFDNIGGIFKNLFNDVLQGQNTWFRNMENSKTFIRQLKEKHHYSEWDNETFKFTTEKGDKIEITFEQAMHLYATAKREYGDDFQKTEHLFEGGIVIEPSSKKLKDVVEKFKDSDKKGRKRIAEAFSEEVDSRAHRITPDDILKVKFWLTDEQLAYIDEFVDYLSKDMAELGNQISMQLYGIRKYNEKYYIPYNSAQNFLYSQPDVNNEARLKHQSFTKNTVVGANNPLILSDFSRVCADHINRMCMYNALTIPLENMNKILNFKTSPGGDMNIRSVQSEIERVYGKAAVSYLKTFIEDMNGNIRVSNTDKAINNWISKFKKGTVFFSASVTIQQPSAIIRAMAYINPKYFLSTALKFSERDYQECIRYAPVAGIKDMGRFDTGVEVATTNWLLQETPKGLKNKTKAFLDFEDSTYRDDKFSYFAAKADEMTWNHIWAAVKAEIADTTDLKVGSEKYFEECGRRFTEVINYTQVYDSTISRSQIMRDKSTGAQMMTAFMSEPTVSLNLLMNAVKQAKNGGKQGKKFAAGAVAAFVGSVALNAVLKSIITAARDDEEDKTYLEKWLEHFKGNFLSDINPLGLIPFAKDIISVFEGYTVERADMNLFSDLAQSVKILNSEDKNTYEKFEAVLGSLSAFLGIPSKNILRDGRAVYNMYNDIFINDKVDRAVNKEVKGYLKELSENKTYKSFDEEDKEKLQKRIIKTVRNEKESDNNKKEKDKFAVLYEKLRKDQKEYKKMRKEMIEEGYTANEITNGVEIARVAYMKSIGIDVGEYLLYKIATSEKHADTDKSGGVSKKEKIAAVNEMDIDEKIKKYFNEKHK